MENLKFKENFALSSRYRSCELINQLLIKGEPSPVEKSRPTVRSVDRLSLHGPTSVRTVE